MKNLLPKDGTVEYLGKILTEEQSSVYYVKLMNEINWQNDIVKIFGKEIITKRKVAWYGDEAFQYKYSGKTKIAENWLEFLTSIKSTVEEISGCTFNSCLLNLYHNGSEAMSWHSDNEKEILENSAIASVSFGAERKFGFRHNSYNLYYVKLYLFQFTFNCKKNYFFYFYKIKFATIQIILIFKNK